MGSRLAHLQGQETSFQGVVGRLGPGCHCFSPGVPALESVCWGRIPSPGRMPLSAVVLVVWGSAFAGIQVIAGSEQWPETLGKAECPVNTLSWCLQSWRGLRLWKFMVISHYPTAPRQTDTPEMIHIYLYGVKRKLTHDFSNKGHRLKI